MPMSLRSDAKQYYVTATGMAELRQQLVDLRGERAKSVGEVRELTSQSSAGSALEDPLRALHQDRVMDLDSQISRLEHIIGTAKVIDQPASNGKVQLGSRVTVDMGGSKRTYTIVGSIEADPDRGKVSNESPLGQSLLGKKVHDRFEITNLARSGFSATVISIE